MADKISDQELENIESEWVSNPTQILCARFSDLLRQAGRLDESREIASAGLVSWKNSVSIKVVLGKCYRDSGLLEKAIETFDDVHSLQPQNLVALRNLAEIHFQKGNWIKAVNYYEEYLFEHPGDEEARDKFEEARSKIGSSAQILDNIDKDETEPGDDIFPKTDRMNKVLESQGISTEPTAESDDQESGGNHFEEDSQPGGTPPGNLIGFFTEEEKQNLHLKPYDEDLE